MTVEFEEESKFNSTYQSSTPDTVSGLTGWLIKVGMAKDENRAKNIMITVIIICFALAIYFAVK